MKVFNELETIPSAIYKSDLRKVLDKFMNNIKSMSERMETFFYLTMIWERFQGEESGAKSVAKKFMDESRAFILKNNNFYKTIVALDEKLNQTELKGKTLDAIADEIEELAKISKEYFKEYKNLYSIFRKNMKLLYEEIELPMFPTLPVIEHVKLIDKEEHDKWKDFS